ncbi:MAG: hypothetical protein WAX89_01425 [Alphaproteobacteria bacterium]
MAKAPSASRISRPLSSRERWQRFFLLWFLFAIIWNPIKFSIGGEVYKIHLIHLVQRISDWTAPFAGDIKILVYGAVFLPLGILAAWQYRRIKQAWRNADKFQLFIRVGLLIAAIGFATYALSVYNTRASGQQVDVPLYFWNAWRWSWSLIAAFAVKTGLDWALEDYEIGGVRGTTDVHLDELPGHHDHDDQVVDPQRQ